MLFIMQNVKAHFMSSVAHIEDYAERSG